MGWEARPLLGICLAVATTVSFRFRDLASPPSLPLLAWTVVYLPFHSRSLSCFDESRRPGSVALSSHSGRIIGQHRRI